VTRTLAATLLAVLSLLVLAPAAGAKCLPKTSLLDIQDEVMCVICGVPLVNAGGPQSDDERAFIRAHVERCETKDQIKAALVAEYTPAVLAMPQKKGFDLTAYLVPVIALAAALAAIIAGAIRWRRNRDGAPATSPAPAASAELDADLRRYDL
jgi:cytochrome c-type biogenesis protein CcmH/NrfF